MQVPNIFADRIANVTTVVAEEMIADNNSRYWVIRMFDGGVARFNIDYEPTESELKETFENADDIIIQRIRLA